MQQFILKENVLTDDTLYIAPSGMVFKGGYIAVIKEYSYQNEWSDSLKIRRFKSQSRLEKHLEKMYPEFEF